MLSICAIEHFDDGPQALSEIARVLAPGGELVMSADTLSRKGQYPDLFAAHAKRYHVQRTYTHGELTGLLAERGLDVAEYAYQFRSGWSERLYLTLSAKGGKVGFNAAAPLAALVAASDRISQQDQGAIVLIRARKRPVSATETAVPEPATQAATP